MNIVNTKNPIRIKNVSNIIIFVGEMIMARNTLETLPKEYTPLKQEVTAIPWDFVHPSPFTANVIRSEADITSIQHRMQISGTSNLTLK